MKVQNLIILNLFLFGNLVLLQAQAGLHVAYGSPNNIANSMGYLAVGIQTHGHISFDVNDIQARVGTNPNDLSFNKFGGHVIASNLRIGAHFTSPIVDADVYIKESNPDEPTILLEDRGNDADNWGFAIASGGFRITYNGDYKGLFLASDGTHHIASDQRLKKDIVPMEEGTLDKLMQLKPSSYFYKNTPNREQKAYGFIAQEVQEIFPDVATKSQGEQSYYAINYDKLGVIAVKSIQELETELMEKNEKTEALMCRIAALKKQINIKMGVKGE